jgi:hypothetical protein
LNITPEDCRSIAHPFIERVNQDIVLRSEQSADVQKRKDEFIKHRGQTLSHSPFLGDWVAIKKRIVFIKENDAGD